MYLITIGTVILCWLMAEFEVKLIFELFKDEIFPLGKSSYPVVKYLLATTSVDIKSVSQLQHHFYVPLGVV